MDEKHDLTGKLREREDATIRCVGCHASDEGIVKGMVEDPVRGEIPATGHPECLAGYGKLEPPYRRDSILGDRPDWVSRGFRNEIYEVGSNGQAVGPYLSRSPRLRPGLRNFFHPDNWRGEQVLDERGVWVSDYMGRLYDAIGFAGCLGLIGAAATSTIGIPLLYSWLLDK